MDIAIYIAEFLRQNDEVSLPGIGTFFKQRINGYFDSKKNTYIPPRQFLAFRISDKENTFLPQYLVKTKNISEATANYFIAKYAEKVKDFIATSGNVIPFARGRDRAPASPGRDRGRRRPEGCAGPCRS